MPHTLDAYHADATNILRPCALCRERAMPADYRLLMPPPDMRQSHTDGAYHVDDAVYFTLLPLYARC